MRRHFLKVLGVLALAVAIPVPAAAQDDDNILVIEIAGAANGVVEIELLPDVAPNHVARIKELARAGAYNDVAFHRVIEGFMAQTGDVQHGTREAFSSGRAGTGGSDLPLLEAEFSDLPYEPGTVGMARSRNPNSANSQFFIMFERIPSLDGNYTVFGRVVSGMDVVMGIQRGDQAQNGTVLEPDFMTSVTIKGDG